MGFEEQNQSSNLYTAPTYSQTGQGSNLYQFDSGNNQISLDKSPQSGLYSYPEQPSESKPLYVSDQPGYYTDLVDHTSIVEIPEGKCGALGDCLGWNQPINHEHVKKNQLIRRVMLIVTAQLILVSGLCALFMFIDPITEFVQNEYWMIWVAILLEFVSLFVLFCVRKKFPANFIVLLVFTLATGYMVASVVTYYAIYTVVEAGVITITIFIVLVVYTLVSRTDFRWIGLFLVFRLFAMIIWGSMWFFFWLIGFYSEWIYQLYCILGVLLFIGFILFDTSRLLSKYADPEEYILFAVNLYLDVLNLFLYFGFVG